MTFWVNDALVFGACSTINPLSCNPISSRNTSEWEMSLLAVKSRIRTTSSPGTFCRQGGWGVQCGCTAPSPAQRATEKQLAVDARFRQAIKNSLTAMAEKISTCMHLIDIHRYNVRWHQQAQPCCRVPLTFGGRRDCVFVINGMSLSIKRSSGCCVNGYSTKITQYTSSSCPDRAL